MRKIKKKRLLHTLFIGLVTSVFIGSLFLLNGCIPGMGEQQTYKMDPVWSPDGSQVAFSSNEDGDYEIHIVDVETGQVEKLTNNEDQDIGPAWSSDGQKITFASDRDGNWEIYSIEVDGSNLQKLTYTEEEED